MYVITADTPSSKLSEEDETSKAPSHEDAEDVGEQEELPARQRRKQGNGSQRLSNPRPKRRRQ